MEVAFLLWVGLAVVVGLAANARGRSAIGWIVLAILISPLLALIAVLVMRPRNAPVEASASDPRPGASPAAPETYRGYVLRRSSGIVTAMGQEFADAASARAAIDRALGPAEPPAPVPAFGMERELGDLVTTVDGIDITRNARGMFMVDGVPHITLEAARDTALSRRAAASPTVPEP